MSRTTSIFLICIATPFALNTTACGTIPTTARYDGEVYNPVMSPSELMERRTVPEGYVSIGTVRVQCSRTDGKQSHMDVIFDDSSCSNSELKALLRNKAAQVGGEVLVATHCDRAESASRDLKSISISIVCEADVVRRIQDSVDQTAEDAATATVPPQPPKTVATIALQPPATEEWSMLSKRIDCLSYPVSAATIRDNEARWTLEMGGTMTFITLTSWPDIESLSQHQQRLSAEHTHQDIAYMTSNSSVIAVVTQEPQGAQSMLAELLACR